VIFFCFIKDNMANVLTGFIAKSGTPEQALSRFTQYENLGGCVVYPKGSTTAMTIDHESINQWYASKVGNMMKLKLRYLRTTGGTQIQGGTDDQYVIELPSIVNIDTKRVTASTDATVVPTAITTAVIGKGYAMSANGTSASLVQAVMYDTDAKTFRLLLNRVDSNGTTHAFQSSGGDGTMGWAQNPAELETQGGTTLSFVVDFEIPVTD
jgi:hypothetical protein